MFVTKKHLPRRLFLRGMGVTLALPFLDAMVPARTLLAQTVAGKPPLRFGFVYVPHGAYMEAYTPLTAGTDFEFSRILKPLEPVRQHINVLTNLRLDAPSSHPLSNSMFLAGTRPNSVMPEDVNHHITVDQLIASRIGQETTFPSLELATEDYSYAVGVCEAGYACILLNTLSWKTPTTPLPNETNPRVLFERMFGDGASASQRQARRSESRSILDAITESIGDLQGKLGAADRERVSSYLENVREVERRIQLAAKQTDHVLPEAPIGVPSTYDAHAKLMFDLMLLAYQGDVTRVVAFMLARELSQQTYPSLGITEGHHTISHHQGNPALIEQYTNIATYQASLFGEFVEKMSKTPDGDGSLLDHTMLLYGSGMSNGNGHTHDPLPILMAGRANGQITNGRHIVYPKKTDFADALLSVLDLAGIHEEKFGDSKGRVEL